MIKLVNYPNPDGNHTRKKKKNFWKRYRNFDDKGINLKERKKNLRINQCLFLH